MASDRNAIRAGVVIVVATALIVGGILGIAGLSGLETKKRYVARFELTDDIGGLRAGDDVRIGGFKVGSVTSVELMTDAAGGADGAGGASRPTTTASGARIEVVFDIPARYPLKKGARVTVGGLIGTVFLNVDVIGRGDVLAPGEFVLGSPGLMGNLANAVASFQTEVVPRVNRTVDNVNVAVTEATSVIQDIHKEVPPVSKRVHEVLEDAHVATTQASRAAGNFADLIGDRNPDGKATIASVRRSAEHVEKALPEITSRATGALDRINNRLENLKSTFDDLEKTLASAKVVSSDIRTLISDNRPRLDRIIRNVADTTTNVKALSAEVLRRPSRILWRDDEKTSANIQVYEASREFADGAGQLNDAAESLKRALELGTTDPKRLSELMQKVDESFGRFQEVEGKLYKSVRP